MPYWTRLVVYRSEAQYNQCDALIVTRSRVKATEGNKQTSRTFASIETYHVDQDAQEAEQLLVTFWSGYKAQLQDLDALCLPQIDATHQRGDRLLV